MKIVLINPPHPAIGSRIPREHLPPLGLLAIGGPLLDAGHKVSLVDAEFGPLPVPQIVSSVVASRPDAILIGHSGSTSGHPSATVVARALRAVLPDTWIIYGGVFPTYHWRNILEQESAFDFVVRGEGEETIVKLVQALQNSSSLQQVNGIVFREGTTPGQKRQRKASLGKIHATLPARIIPDLDTCRIGWELIEPARYTYYGHRRAVVMQFSRGCPHRCNYCGQHGFWRAWRHRDPVKFAKEIAWLHFTTVGGAHFFYWREENHDGYRWYCFAFLEEITSH